VPYRFVRLSRPDVTPLQVWDLRLPDGNPLWSALGASHLRQAQAMGQTPHEIANALAQRVFRAVECIHETFGIQQVPTYLRQGFKSVCVYGGLALLPFFREALVHQRKQFGWHFHVSKQGRDYAAYAKRAIFGKDCTMHVCDVGQTSLKLYTPQNTRVICTRDPVLVPYGACPDKASLTAQFVGSALAELLLTARPGAPLLLALPCPIDSSFRFGANTYGFEGQGLPFVTEILHIAKAAPNTTVYLANDAELAAECAREETLTLGNTLALTLGHGPGAAILHG